MTYIPDLTDMTLPDGRNVQELWVGWLGDEVHTAGPTDPRVLAGLRSACSTAQIPDGTMGSHECEICGNARGHGQFFVEDRSARYIMPNLVLHYIEAHGYRLPPEVEAAILRPMGH